MANNLQDIFLNTARKKGVRVTVYLMNGVRIQGKIKAFDTYTILIENGTQQSLVFKQAVSTIVPSERMDIEFEKAKEQK